MKRKILSLLALLVALAALVQTAAQAATISAARVVNANSRDYGDLQLTMNGQNKIVVRSIVRKAWIIENGGAVVYSIDGGRAMDFQTHLLMRYDPKNPSVGDDAMLIGHFTEIDSVQVSRTRSGKEVLVVSGTSDGTDAPTAAIVDPKRGAVWSQYNSRIMGIRNGRVAVAVYNREEGGEPDHKPIRYLYPDLDTLLKRPALPKD